MLVGQRGLGTVFAGVLPASIIVYKHLKGWKNSQEKALIQGDRTGNSKVKSVERYCKLQNIKVFIAEKINLLLKCSKGIKYRKALCIFNLRVNRALKTHYCR